MKQRRKIEAKSNNWRTKRNTKNNLRTPIYVNENTMQPALGLKANNLGPLLGEVGFDKVTAQHNWEFQDTQNKIQTDKSEMKTTQKWLQIGDLGFLSNLSYFHSNIEIWYLPRNAICMGEKLMFVDWSHGSLARFFSIYLYRALPLSPSLSITEALGASNKSNAKCCLLFFRFYLS